VKPEGRGFLLGRIGSEGGKGGVDEKARGEPKNREKVKGSRKSFEGKIL